MIKPSRACAQTRDRHTKTIPIALEQSKISLSMTPFASRVVIQIAGLVFFQASVHGAASLPKNSDGSSPDRAIVLKNADEESDYLYKHFTFDGILPERRRDGKRGVVIEKVRLQESGKLKTVVYFTYPIDKNDYFAKGWWTKPSDTEVKYRKQIQHVLERGFQRDVVMRALVLPPFDPESIVGIIKSPTGYHAFVVKPSDFIWGTLQEYPQALPKLRGLYYDRSISVSQADRVLQIWRSVLADPHNYRTEKAIYTDAWQFIFYLGSKPLEHITASTVAVGQDTKAFALVSLSDCIYWYVLRKRSEPTFQQAIQTAETRLYNHK